MARTGFVFHERYLWHDTRSAAGFVPAGGMVEPDRHAENPDTKRRLKSLLEVSGLLAQLERIEPRMASEHEVLRVHGREYLERVKKLSAENGGDAGALTPFGPGSYEIALLSAGGTLAATDAVLDGRVRNAYALVRPPGHHAEADLGMGFCIFSNVAIAVRHAREVRGLARVAVVDWDVHHGNGTESAFLRDPSVLTISLHQDNYFPAGRGFFEHGGEGAGKGFNLNLPLPPGSGHGAYVAAFERVVVPALRRFRPEAIFVASGFDGGAMDPLGRMLATSATFRALTRSLMTAADELCGGRLILSHEGGYSTAHVPFCGLAVIEELSGIATGVLDPFLDFFAGMGGQQLQPHQDTAIRRAEKMLAAIR
jgi:acetoin utilization deacetylase AcuC-like enzyme